MSIATQTAVIVPQEIWELTLRELQQNKANIEYLLGIVKANEYLKTRARKSANNQNQIRHDEAGI